MASLDRMPAELVEMIVTDLDLADICRLRLVSRELCHKATQDRCRSFYRKKRIELTLDSLHEFATVTSSEPVSGSIEEIALVGEAFDTAMLEVQSHDMCLLKAPVPRGERERLHEELAERIKSIASQRERYEYMHRAGMDGVLLAKGFANVRRIRGERKAISLSLEIQVTGDSDFIKLAGSTGVEVRAEDHVARMGFRAVWTAATDLFRTTMMALETSGMTLKKLGLFREHRARATGISCYDLGTICKLYPKADGKLSPVTSLSVSVSNRALGTYIPYDQRQLLSRHFRQNIDPIQKVLAEETEERNFTGLVDLLRRCKDLEDLEIYYYHFDSSDCSLPPKQGYDSVPFQRIVEVQSLGGVLCQLRRCRLIGVWVTEEHLLKFLKQSSIGDLSLQRVSLIDGRYKPVFDYLSQDATHLQHLSLSSLCERDDEEEAHDPRPIAFLPHVDETSRMLELDRTGNEIRQPINYEQTRHRGWINLDWGLRWLSQYRRNHVVYNY